MGVDPEGFPTHLTAVRLLSRMDPLVLPQGRAAAEALVTLSALVGFLPGVNPLVTGELGALLEGFPTLVTFEGFLP